MLRTLADADVPRLVEIGREPQFARWWPDLDAASLAAKAAGTSGSVVMRSYERGADGSWHDGLLMELLAAELT